MFLLVSVRHVGAHPGEHQHGVSIQISISLGKTFLRISRIRNIPLTWILARVFAYLPSFISQILDFVNRTVLIFILIYFEWRDTENQQYPKEIQSLYQWIDQNKWSLKIKIILPFLADLSSIMSSFAPEGNTEKLHKTHSGPISWYKLGMKWHR